MTTIEKDKLKSHKLKWRETMRNHHPSFTKRKWALSSWRINHLQPI